MVTTIKFSEFVDGGAFENSNKLVGLEDGKNTQFDSSAVYTPLPMTVVDALSLIVAPNNSYVAANPGQVAFTLPVEFAVGDIFEFSNSNGGFIVMQNPDQQMFVGIKGTTVGDTGSIASTAFGDSIVLKGIVANTTLLAIPAPQGNILIV